MEPKERRNSSSRDGLDLPAFAFVSVPKLNNQLVKREMPRMDKRILLVFSEANE